MTDTSKLLLYMKPTCPYCRRVQGYMKESGIKLAEVDITAQPEARDELVRVGGKAQVPCLLIDGEPMYESEDIIQFLAAEVA